MSAIAKSPNRQITNSRAGSGLTTPAQREVCCIGQALATKCRMIRVMTKFLNALAISTLLLVPASAANAQVSFGIHIGEPPAPRAYIVPARPGVDYVWVEGYQYPEGGRYKWHNGYWTRPPYQGAYWVEPYTSAAGTTSAAGKATTETSTITIIGTAPSSVTSAATTATITAKREDGRGMYGRDESLVQHTDGPANFSEMIRP